MASLLTYLDYAQVFRRLGTHQGKPGKKGTNVNQNSLIRWPVDIISSILVENEKGSSAQIVSFLALRTFQWRFYQAH